MASAYAKLRGGGDGDARVASPAPSGARKLMLKLKKVTLKSEEVPRDLARSDVEEGKSTKSKSIAKDKANGSETVEAKNQTNANKEDDKDDGCGSALTAA